MAELEEMSDFFAKRADTYDAHMLNEVAGCKKGYVKMAELLPEGAENLLDLGCGTGLELDEIFKARPDLRVTGVDLTREMLGLLAKKHPKNSLTLVNADYFAYDFGVKQYDAAVSFETLHHFSHERKTGLYRRLCRALKDGGRYIECDYMAERQEEEDFCFCENARLRREQNIPEGELTHYDTPCTVANQTAMLKAAGFARAEAVWRLGNTVMLVAEKAEGDAHTKG